MSALGFVLWMLNMLVDTGGQMSFKVAASQDQDVSASQHWKRMFCRPWIWLGIFCYICEFFVWMAFISEMPLSTAIMLGSINIVAIMMAGRIFFRETFSPLRISGILLITLGVAVVGLGG